MNSPTSPQAPASAPEAQTRFYDGSSYSKENSVGFAMKRCLSLLVRNLEARMQALDLTGMQWQPLLQVLYGCDTVAACAREPHTDAGAMTRMLDRLEAKGLLARERSTVDRRVVNLALTPRGHEVAKQIPDVLADILNQHLQGFTPQEFRTLLGLLQRFADNGEALAAASGAHAGTEPNIPASEDAGP